MSTRIIADIYSGVPNPTVTLTGAAEKDFLARLQPTVKLSGAEAASAPEGRLGYRGYLIESDSAATKALSRDFRLVDGKLFGSGVTYRVSDAGTEQFLGSTNGPFGFSAAVSALLQGDIAARRANPMAPAPQSTDSVGPALPCPCAPFYEPTWWNDSVAGGRQVTNNCYNYAANYRTDTFAQPGLASGQMYPLPIASSSMIGAATRDALASTSNPKCPAQGHLVALFIAPGLDFHWYRMGRNQFWSHKPGPSPVTNVDNAGALIADPRNADRGIYTQFCCFMIVMHGHVKIR
jgi:hypothetical protein